MSIARRFVGRVLALVCLSAATAGAEPVGLFEILRHEVNAEGSAQIFDGGPADTFDFDFDLPGQVSIGTGASDSTGPGAGGTTAGAGFRSAFGSGGPGIFIMSTGVTASYVGGTPPWGGTSDTTMVSIIEFVMPAERADFTVAFRRDSVGFFSQSGSVLMENITANQELFFANDSLTFLGSFVSNVGDVIRVTSDFSAQGNVPADVFGVFGGLVSLDVDVIVPEPASVGFLGIGAVFCLSVRRRGRR